MAQRTLQGANDLTVFPRVALSPRIGLTVVFSGPSDVPPIRRHIRSGWLRAVNGRAAEGACGDEGPIRIRPPVRDDGLPPRRPSQGPGESLEATDAQTLRDGARNMVDKRFSKPVIYEQQRRFKEGAAQEMRDQRLGQELLRRWAGQNRRPATSGWRRLRQVKASLNLMVVMLYYNKGANDIYTSLKHFRDLTMGMATRCLKTSKYFCLPEDNVARGGINTIPDHFRCNPLRLGGSDGRPSFIALVANVGHRQVHRREPRTSCQEKIQERVATPYRCT
ncbi:hypothetical protein B0H17DRAFT_1140017 [Mycena rosella]|uniref:Uncharacterized protein n=1 Tax=Mycena rosella TaxID=1033263 RepID=A0AAD7GAL6_MYCRO|nr:hypothetical protein B0H17DRAFT_1140017 [Mycena rosella]